MRYPGVAEPVAKEAGPCRAGRVDFALVGPGAPDDARCHLRGRPSFDSLAPKAAGAVAGGRSAEP
jgi:hypothetical protein